MIIKLGDTEKAKAIREVENKKDEELTFEDLRKIGGVRVSRRPNDPKWHMWVVYAVIALAAPFMVIGAFFAAIYDKVTKKK